MLHLILGPSGTGKSTQAHLWQEVRGSQIINIASVAAFQPIPYIDIYGATKAFVLSFSRALNRELRKQGIGVMAVCPFWTKTAFFDRAVTSGERVVKKYIAMYDPDDIVRRTWRDAKRGKAVCKYGFVARMDEAAEAVVITPLFSTADGCPRS